MKKRITQEHKNKTHVWGYDLGYIFGSVPFYMVSGMILTVTANVHT